MADPRPLPTHEEVLAVCNEVFACDSWSFIGDSRHQAYMGTEAICPANVYVELDNLGPETPHWFASIDGDLASARVGEFMSTEEQLLERGILPGSIEELREVLEALRFNLGQVLVEMQRSYVQATGREHVYVESSR